MKLKDHKKSLAGIKVKTRKGVVGYWRSQWGYSEGKAGVWLTKDLSGERVYPQFIDNLKECLEWDVTTEDSNCDILIDMEHIEDYKDES